MEFRVQCAGPCKGTVAPSDIGGHRKVPEGEGWREEFFCTACAARLDKVLEEVTA